MPRYRTDTIAELARQMQFTPLATRSAQVTSAEGVLHDIESGKAYPVEWLIFRLTGYRPKAAPKDLLTGLALQHDLGLLIEQVSESLEQKSEDLGQPVLSLEEASQKFNVTSKTLQRWRRRGLSGRRLIFPDGKRRIGFLLFNLERFLARQGRQTMTAANFSPLEQTEQKKILAAARRLAGSGCALSEITRRVGKQFNRSAVLIEQNVLDQLPTTAAEISPEMHARIYRRYRHGVSLRDLAETFVVRRRSLYWTILDERAVRIRKRKTKFIDDPLYHLAGSAQTIQAIADVRESMPMLHFHSTADLQRVSECPVLTAAQERALFLKLNFHKYQFVIARRRLDERLITHRQLGQIERHLAEANSVRNQIVAANLRLLVSVARRHARGCVGLMDLISDGTLALMRAVESYDFHKGNHFSTYATFALMKEFARSSGRMIARHKRFAALAGDMADQSAQRRNEIFLNSEHLERLFLELTDAERAVLRAQYGLQGIAVARNYQQIARTLGITAHEARQLERTAIVKLRAAGMQE